MTSSPAARRALAQVLSCMHDPQNIPAPPAVTIAMCIGLEREPPKRRNSRKVVSKGSVILRSPLRKVPESWAVAERIDVQTTLPQRSEETIIAAVGVSFTARATQSSPVRYVSRYCLRSVLTMRCIGSSPRCFLAGQTFPRQASHLRVERPWQELRLPPE